MWLKSHCVQMACRLRANPRTSIIFRCVNQIALSPALHQRSNTLSNGQNKSAWQKRSNGIATHRSPIYSNPNRSCYASNLYSHNWCFPDGVLKAQTPAVLEVNLRTKIEAFAPFWECSSKDSLSTSTLRLLYRVNHCITRVSEVSSLLSMGSTNTQHSHSHSLARKILCRWVSLRLFGS